MRGQIPYWPLSQPFQMGQRLFKFIDSYLGRGSYRWVQSLMACQHEYSCYVYAKMLSELVMPNTRWLEAGCGHQILENRLALEENELVSRSRLAVGCDVFTDSLKRHRSLEKIVSCTIETLPFPDRSFDLVTLNMVAEHLPVPERVFSEIGRVLDQNGLLLIHTPNAASYEVKMIRLGWKVFPRRVGLRMIRFLEQRDAEDVFPTFYRANTRRQLLTLARGAGLEQRELRAIEGRPLFYFGAPVCILEIVFRRFLRLIGQDEVALSPFIGIYQRTQ